MTTNEKTWKWEASWWRAGVPCGGGDWSETLVSADPLDALLTAREVVLDHADEQNELGFKAEALIAAGEELRLCVRDGDELVLEAEIGDARATTLRYTDWQTPSAGAESVAAYDDVVRDAQDIRGELETWPEGWCSVEDNYGVTWLWRDTDDGHRAAEADVRVGVCIRPGEHGGEIAYVRGPNGDVWEEDWESLVADLEDRVEEWISTQDEEDEESEDEESEDEESEDETP